MNPYQLETFEQRRRFFLRLAANLAPHAEVEARRGEGRGVEVYTLDGRYTVQRDAAGQCVVAVVTRYRPDCYGKAAEIERRGVHRCFAAAAGQIVREYFCERVERETLRVAKMAGGGLE